MRNVYLHGTLGAEYGTHHMLDVATAGEAVRAICANFPEALKTFYDGSWHVIRGDYTDGMSLGEEEVRDFKLGDSDLHIMPAIAGSKSDDGSGLLKTIIGVAIVGAAFAFSGGMLATPLMTSGMLSSVTWGNVALFGAGLALAGVSSMLAGEEKDNEDNDNSFIMSGPQNQGNQGSAVPVAYGELIVGTVPISAGITVENVPINSARGAGGIGSKGGK